MENITLGQLSAHMKQPVEDRLHSVFTFSGWNSGELNVVKSINFCGTKGCMAGELPLLDPVNWYFNSWGHLRYSEDEFDCIPVYKNLANYFGITENQARDLFYPNSTIHEEASLEQVIAYLDRFLENNPQYK